MKVFSTAMTLCCMALIATASAQGQETEINPAAGQSDHPGSDAEAVEVAEKVMQALGGRAAWDSTRHVRWRFFGRRLLVWNKHTGDIRIEGEERDSGESYVILMNLSNKRGRAWRSGEEIASAEDLDAMLDRGEAIWINDSYWMFMPYKLQDSGVTLRYVGEESLADGRPADVLELTFRDVGRTPDNKYHVFVSKDRHLVEQWAFYENASDPQPRITTPWGNWQRFGSILLSDDRGDRDHTDLAVFETLPDSVYLDPAPVDWESLQ